MTISFALSRTKVEDIKSLVKLEWMEESKDKEQ